MSRCRFLRFLLLAGLVLTSTAPIASAADPREATGVLRAVDAQGGSVILKTTTGQLAELRVTGSTTIMLEGKAVGLDALKPGMVAIIGLNDGDDTVRSITVETEPVRLRIAISEEGECRIVVGRSIPEALRRPDDELVPITTSYANSFVKDKATASEAKGSSRFEPEVPKYAKSSSMLLYPRAFRLPCVLLMDLAELRDGSVGVQFITPTVNLVVYVESEDGLRETAKIVAVASGNDKAGGAGPSFSNAQNRVKVEQPVALSRPEELRFKLPFSPRQLGDLYTIDAVLRARPGQENPRPVVAIRNAELHARRESTLGMELGVDQGKLVVERVEPDGLAAKAKLAAGDVIVALDGHKIPVLRDAGGLTLAFDLGVKPKVILTIARGGKEQAAPIEFE